MATFNRQTSATVYIIAESKRKANLFARRKGLSNAIPVTRVEDLPRRRGLSVILLPGYDQLEDYECFFGEGGLLRDYEAHIYYPNEVPAIN